MLSTSPDYHGIHLYNPSVTALAKAYLEIEKELIESRKTISLLQSELNKYTGTKIL